MEKEKIRTLFHVYFSFDHCGWHPCGRMLIPQERWAGLRRNEGDRHEFETV